MEGLVVAEQREEDYHVSISQSEDNYNYNANECHEVCLEVVIELFVHPDVEPTLEVDGWWCLQELPGGLSGLRDKVMAMLDGAHVPLAARNTTLRMIFEDVLMEYRWKSSVKEAVSINLMTATVLPFSDDSESDEEFEVLMEEDFDSESDDEFEVLMEEDFDSESDDEFEVLIEEDFDSESDDEFEVLMEEDYPLRATPATREAVEALERVRVSGTEREVHCSVCLEEFSVGIEATRMPCSHVFHRDCLVRWLENRCFCPLCKFELPMSTENMIEH